MLSRVEGAELLGGGIDLDVATKSRSACLATLPGAQGARPLREPLCPRFVRYE
jgi:hypothetical protein